MLHAKILRSPHAHARILNIDTSRAERLPGVRAVITGRDIAGVKWGVFSYTRDQAMLAVDKVRYLGEDVAAVAAVDEDTALEAMKLIEVEYEELPAVFDPVEAMKEGAPRVHDHAENNINILVPIEVGDVDRGFQQAHYIREDTFRAASHGYFQLEPYTVLINCDASGSLELWMPTASPHTKAKALANLLKMPLHKVKVRKVYSGGAFGGRSDVFPGDLIAALLSLKARRPVRLAYTREETLTGIRQIHSMVVNMKTGVKEDGTFIATDIKSIMDGGAYSSTGPIAASVPFLVWEETYRLPNVRFNGYRIYTNKPVRGMYGSHGRAFLGGLGMQLDMIAEELGIDPVEIRLRNALQTGDVQATGSKVISCGLSEALEKAAERSGWKEKRGKLPHGKGIGMGCSGMMVGFPMGIRGGSSAFIKFNEDAGATLISGVADNGQGNDSMLVQIAADVLGMRMDEINLVSADSEITTLDQGAYSQAVAFVSGNAVLAAAKDARRQVLTVASDMLGVSPSRLDLKDHKIYAVDDPRRSLPLHKAVRYALVQNAPIMGRGSYMPKVDQEREWVNNPRGQQAGTFSFGAFVVEVDVDVETGKVRITRVTGAHDCGFAINPMAVEGQFDGNISRAGVGASLLEEHIWDGGQMLNANMLDHKLPLSVDMPTEIERIIIETFDPEGPFGAKEAGLAGAMNLFQAVGNAVYDAVGVWLHEYPFTPERVLEALEAADEDGE
jgi:4-hydroxybenzoyl-CoA reductase subunit alpha